jgi:hypothetical protein
MHDEDAIGPQPGESRKERVDRELREVLEEIRVALPGVELLLGFLLILPFSERFTTIDGGLRAAYLACFVTTAASIALFVAPTACHRLGFREIDKERLVIRTNAQVLGGLALLAAAIGLAAFVVGAVVLDAWWAGVIAGAVALWLAYWWFWLPSCERRRHRRAGGDAVVGPTTYSPS